MLYSTGLLSCMIAFLHDRFPAWLLSCMRASLHKRFPACAFLHESCTACAFLHSLSCNALSCMCFPAWWLYCMQHILFTSHTRFGWIVILKITLLRPIWLFLTFSSTGSENYGYREYQNRSLGSHKSTHKMWFACEPRTGPWNHTVKANLIVLDLWPQINN